MDIASANSGRAGSYRHLADGLRAFLPKPLPPDPPLDMDEPLQVLLSGADQSLGRLDGAVQILPDSDLFVFMFMRREAVLSSQIEGTQSSLDDVLRAEAGILDPDRPRDVGEVLGYIAALRHGTRAIAQGRGMSVELMLALHDRLMSGARGGSFLPGRLRDDIVWIGAQGASLDEATFVPPPAMEVSAHLHDLARFIEQEDSLPALVKIGLAHAQFETIHPFFDGNGRVGRQLITLLLMRYRTLHRPVLYLSHYLKARRTEYYRRLQAVRDEGAWEHWLAFFLAGISAAARESADTGRKIVALREEGRETLLMLDRSAASALRLHEQLFATPIIGVARAAECLGIGFAAANRLIDRMVDCGVLRELTGHRRNRRFAYQRYIDLFAD